MKILVNKKETGAIKDYIGTCLSMIPENVKVDDKEVQEIRNIFNPKPIFVSVEKEYQGYELDEEIIIEGLKKACQLLLESETEIKSLIEILASIKNPDEEIEMLKTDIKEAAMFVIKKREWRQKIMNPLNRIADIVRRQMKVNKEEEKKTNEA